MAAQQAAPDDRDEAYPEQPEAMREPRRRHACRDPERSKRRQILTDRNQPLRTGVLWTRRRFGRPRDDSKLRPERPEQHGQEKKAVAPREGHDAPLTDECAATRGRSAAERGDGHAGAKSASSIRAPVSRIECCSRQTSSPSELRPFHISERFPIGAQLHL